MKGSVPLTWPCRKKMAMGTGGGGGGGLTAPSIVIPGQCEEEDEEYEQMQTGDLPEQFRHFTLRKQTSYRSVQVKSSLYKWHTCTWCCFWLLRIVIQAMSPNITSGFVKIFEWAIYTSTMDENDFLQYYWHWHLRPAAHVLTKDFLL